MEFPHHLENTSLVYSCCGCFFWGGVFLDQFSFPFVINSPIQAFTQLLSQSIMDGHDFLKIRMRVCHRGLVFSNLVLSLELLLLIPDVYPLLDLLYVCPVGCGCRIHRLLLCKGIRPPHNECPVYDTKQSDGEVPMMLEIYGMRCTPSLPSLLGPPGVVAPDHGPINGSNRTKLWFRVFTVFAFKLRIYAKLNCLKRTVMTFKLRN